MISDKEKHKAYIKEHLHTVLQELVSAVLVDQPTHLERYLLDWLRERNGEKLSAAEAQEMQDLKQQLVSLREGQQSHSDDTDDSEDDYLDDLPPPSDFVLKARHSVSAEAFGEWNRKESFRPKVVPKSDNQRQRISLRLCKAFMFSALEAGDKVTVIDAMEERRFAAGEMVIVQGDDGSELFLVDSGTLECIKTENGEGKVVRVYNPGESFGELALLYNAPRAASIRAVTEAVCWVLDRECFNHIVKDASMRKRELYEGFLEQVTLFEEMQPYERSQVADALQTVHFAAGDYVIREGEWGDVFYIVEEGTAEALRTLTPGCPPERVHGYEKGQYFGELALLRGEPRAASIVATSALKCVTLGRRAFKRMVGPLEEVLRRNAEKYRGYLMGN